MYIVTVFSIIANIAIIAALLTGLFYTFKAPKNKAVFGYVMVGCMIAYILTLSLFIISETVAAHNFIYMWLILCIISPFIIGKFASFKTLKKYTAIQTVCFLTSLAALFTAL